ncbi:uncharacterized protein DS421_14g481960 [Arachis hypogaea]|nr:uncharacterized protein DS421_14g481960 [Arachis hypogaea]
MNESMELSYYALQGIIHMEASFFLICVFIFLFSSPPTFFFPCPIFLFEQMFVLIFWLFKVSQAKKGIYDSWHKRFLNVCCFVSDQIFKVWFTLLVQTLYILYIYHRNHIYLSVLLLVSVY